MPIILVNERNCISFPAYVITSFAPAEPPFDKIKLDQSFITEVETSPQSNAIIRAVLALGNSLQIPVLAKGIETEGQFSLLGAEGVTRLKAICWAAPPRLRRLFPAGSSRLPPKLSHVRKA